MTLESKAQEFFVIEPEDVPSVDGDGMLMESPIEVLEMLSEDEHMELPELEVVEQPDLVIVIDDIPGAPKGTKLPEITLEEGSEDDEEDSEKDSKDSNSAATSSNKWDWSNLNPDEFIVWVKERINTIPKHSGFDTSGLERSVAYLERLDAEISRAMRADLDENLDANLIEKARDQIDTGINAAKKRIADIKEYKKRNKKAEDQVSDIKKEGKAAGVKGVMVTVPLLISSLARTLINGVVSAGHDLPDMYKKLVEKYELTDREQAELLQLLDDMNYPIYMDRGHLPDEDYSRDSQGNFDWAANYQS